MDLNYFQYVPRRSETGFGELRSSAVRIRGVLWVVYEEGKKLPHNEVGKSGRKKKELAVEHSGGITTHNHSTRAYGGLV